MSAPEDRKDLLAEAQRQLRRRELSSAISLFEDLTQSSPESAEAWLGLGMAFLAQGDIDQATCALRHSHKLSGDEGEALHLLLLAEAVRGQARRAAELLGRCKSPDFLDEIEPLRWAIRKQRRSLVRRWLQTLGWPFRNPPRLLPAVLYLMILFPNRLTYRMASTVLWGVRRRTRLEIILRDRLRRLNAGGAKNLQRLASLLIETDQPEAAETIAIESEASYPRLSIFPLLAGHAAFAEGNRSAASEHYERASGDSRRDCLPALHLAASRVYAKDVEGARKTLTQTSERYPSEPLVALFDRIPDEALATLPKAVCIAERENHLPHAIAAGQLPDFPFERSAWDTSSRLAETAERLYLRSTRQRHAPARKNLRRVPCPACLSEQVEPFATNWAAGLSLGRCTRCYHVFAQPMPTPEGLTRLYNDAYFSAFDRYMDQVRQANAAAQSLPPHPAFEATLDWLAQVDFDAWQQSRGDGRLALDVGCSDGGLLLSLRARGWNVRGQDLVAAYADYYQSLGIPYDPLPIEKIDDRPAAFDLCTLYNVIEHLANPGAMLETLGRWLKPGGRLLVVTPCGETATAWIAGKSWYNASEHVQFFCADSLRRLGRRCGLEPLYWQTLVGVRLDTPFRNWRNRFIGGPLEKLLEATGQGDVIKIVFEKPA